MKIIKFLFYIFIIIIGMSGCKMKRDISVSYSNVEGSSQETIRDLLGETIYVDTGPIDRDALIEYFFGMTVEEAKKQGVGSEVIGGYWGSKDGKEFSYSEDANVNFVHFVDYIEGAGYCYSNLITSRTYLRNELSSRLRIAYPDKELEQYSCQEAIKACEPVAKACGYEDAELTVYAMSLECLQSEASFQQSLAEGAPILSAPDPTYIYISNDDIRAAKASGDLEKVDRLYSERNGMSSRGIPWTKKDEAYLLVYRSYINGMLLDSSYYMMFCIYVPQYERIVYMEAYAPMIMCGKKEGVELVSQETAISEVMMKLKIKSEEDISITDISLVYSPRNTQAGVLAQTKTVDPCWRIDYVLNPDTQTREQYEWDDGTMLINAVDGRENLYYDY